MAAHRHFGLSFRMFAFLCDSLLTWFSLRLLFDMPRAHTAVPSVMHGSTQDYSHDCVRREPERACECDPGNVRCRESKESSARAKIRVFIDTYVHE